MHAFMPVSAQPTTTSILLTAYRHIWHTSHELGLGFGLGLGLGIGLGLGLGLELGLGLARVGLGLRVRVRVTARVDGCGECLLF